MDVRYSSCRRVLGCERTSDEATPTSAMMIRYARETLPPGEAAGLELASRMTLVRILDRGFISYRRGIQGRGRWDGRNDIFRCIMLCENCHASECNKRMWYQLDNHESHLCETCLRDHRARALRC